tara:strand:- start:922 stop:1104 length:183 start_codon:yes stop_codon:yes gene_type:complete
MIDSVTKDDLKATVDMILKKDFPNAKYKFLNDVLVWEDSAPQPTDSDLQNRIKLFDSALG